MHRRPAWLLAALLLLPACATTHRSFAPRVNASAISPDGLPAAQYPLADKDGPTGDVRVWADADLEKVDGVDAAVVHVGIEMVNRGQKDLSIDVDAVRLQEVEAGGEPAGAARTLRALGNPVAHPGHSTRMHFYLQPAGVPSARALTAFDVHWQVRTVGAADAGYEQVTPFAIYQGYYPYYRYPYYYGYGYGWWGPWGYWGGWGPWGGWHYYWH
jgi:hypothetical protein